MFQSKSSDGKTGRRGFILSALGVAAGFGYLVDRSVLHGLYTLAAAPTRLGFKGEVTLVDFDDSGKRLGLVKLPKIYKSEAEWRQQLSPLAFQITRQAGTEIAFTGPLNDNYKPGIYRCICCGTAV